MTATYTILCFRCEGTLHRLTTRPCGSLREAIRDAARETAQPANGLRSTVMGGRFGAAHAHRLSRSNVQNRRVPKGPGQACIRRVPQVVLEPSPVPQMSAPSGGSGACSSITRALWRKVMAERG